MEEKKIIEVKDLSIHRVEKNFWLKQIQFYLQEGEVLGIIGENGCGKSTLLKGILGLLKMESGEVYIHGYRLGKEDKDWKAYVGYVSLEAMNEVTGKGIHVAKHLGSYYPDFSLEEFERYCGVFQIDCKKTVEELSTGGKILFGIAFALAHNPRLLVLDEPFSGLDPIIRENVIELLREVLEEGNMAMIYATHLMSELEQMADRILYIENGRQKIFADVNELQDTYFKGKKMDFNELFE